MKGNNKMRMANLIFKWFFSFLMLFLIGFCSWDGCQQTKNNKIAYKKNIIKSKNETIITSIGTFNRSESRMNCENGYVFKNVGSRTYNNVTQIQVLDNNGKAVTCTGYGWKGE
jgi:hypothetical protein